MLRSHWDEVFDSLIFGESNLTPQFKYDRSLYNSVTFLLHHLPSPPPLPTPAPPALYQVSQLPALLSHPVTRDIFEAFLVDGDEEALLENLSILANMDGQLVSDRPTVQGTATTAAKASGTSMSTCATASSSATSLNSADDESQRASRNLPQWSTHHAKTVQTLEYWAGSRPTF
mmetsp:Transcript_7833/g.25104  ORF Transcript_7833/g.25104 Transcript_7833/m.25104 type:complete len:174 (-) Transcript_7833:2079-2600(-)